MDSNYIELSDFNPEIYRISPDLRGLSYNDLESHYLNYGVKEGRFYNKILDRRSFLESIDKKGKILEIGPLDNPQLDHQTANYYSIDVFDKKTLIENYKNDPNVKKDKIIEPSFVIVNNDFSSIKEKFNCIFSSHNIEHIACIVTFLNNLERLLTREGSINFIIPDKRYCFDYFKKETTIYDVLQMYHEKHVRPRLSDVLRMRIQSTHNDSDAHWNTEHHGQDNTEADLPLHYEAILKEYNSSAYIDAHVSHFTPESFLTIINVLKELNLINLKVHKLYHTLRGALEFYVVLKRNKY